MPNVGYQVLTYAQQSRERSNYEQAALNERMQEYKRQIDRESRCSSNGSNKSPNGDGIQAIGRSSHKLIEAVMQSAAKGKVNNDFGSYVFDCAICFLFICWLLFPCLRCLWSCIKNRFKLFGKVIYRNVLQIWEAIGNEGFLFLIAEGCCIIIVNRAANHL